ncbi:MAG: class I SAM-dependent methyltransferase [Streptomycetaceae bacterium]|nr:class I SAM-dependent methyltransferase [Streptomycetaceae bacterium]
MTQTTHGPTDLLRMLQAHPWVADTRAAPSGELIVRAHPDALAALPVLGGLVREFLDHWRDVYDWVYDDPAPGGPVDADLSGWRASDTGRPLPAAHMADWRDTTAALALATRPTRVLELGCGSGMFAHAFVDRVEAYVGTDVSATAVERLRAQRVPGTTVLHAAAHEAASGEVRRALGGAAPDLVLLNSVTQCFPDLGYLRAVLHDAVELVAPGGYILVGDIRHAGLLGHYCRWVEAAKDPAAGPDEIERRAAVRAEREEEMLLAPGAVARAAAGTGRRLELSVRARTMADDTELTRYRYDALLRVDAPPRGTAMPPVRTVANALLTTEPDGSTPHLLADAARARGGVVLVDVHDPKRLAVAESDAASYTAVEAFGGETSLAHEPLHAFVGRRLPEALRDHLRAEFPQAALPRIRVAPRTEEATGVR